MRFEHYIVAAIPVTYLLMIVVERVRPGRDWPSIAWWQALCFVFFLTLGLINNAVALLLSRALPNVSLFDMSQYNPGVAALFGYVFVSLGNALLHRAYHRFEFLWRHVHRLHHVPHRIDVAGVMLQTPWEMAANAILFVGVSVVLLGLSPVATMLLAYISAVYGMFQHWNVRTPRWLGYAIQRPESHGLHHERGVHAGNYSDLPIWDILWGTFSNPTRFEGRVGLDANLPQDLMGLMAGKSQQYVSERKRV